MKDGAEITFARIIRFGFVGVATLIVFYGTVISLVEFLGSNPLTASALSYVLAITLNYILHFNFTYGGEAKHAQSLPRYLSVTAFGLLLNQLLMYLGMEVALLHYLVAQGIAISLVIVCNFIAFQFWAFASKPG